MEVAVSKSKWLPTNMIDAHETSDKDSGILLLAGGGHSHALMLRHWAINPKKRPAGLIVLVNRTSTNLYSGMIPGVISGKYDEQEAYIDLRVLTNRAKVSLIIAEITGIDIKAQKVFLLNRPSLSYDRLSLDVGAVTKNPINPFTPIKPIEGAYSFIKEQDSLAICETVGKIPFRVLGSGLAGLEIALALRQRWPNRKIELYSTSKSQRIRKILNDKRIDLIGERESNYTKGYGLNCTGSIAASWLYKSGLPCSEHSGRVLTKKTLQVIGHDNIWASGDCGLIVDSPRPASGVWAVKSAKPLWENLEAHIQGRKQKNWNPGQYYMQLIATGHQENEEAKAWLIYGDILLGPSKWFWKLKRAIDIRFIARLHMFEKMGKNQQAQQMLCNGCASKLPTKTLQDGLKSAGLIELGLSPEDANHILNAMTVHGRDLLTSIDGFPAIINDPWLNGRITAFHACSDLWACGAKVESAQAVINIPLCSSHAQQELLSQSLLGVRSALEAQGAKLIGGHTIESRGNMQIRGDLNTQIILNVQGSLTGNMWRKKGIKPGDKLLLSRPLGTGVIFAAAMEGACQAKIIDHVIKFMASSQHLLLSQLRHAEKVHQQHINAATDITGFGLLGHLGEMISSEEEGSLNTEIILDCKKLPSYPGAIDLLRAGFESSLSSTNKDAWKLLDSRNCAANIPAIKLQIDKCNTESLDYLATLKLLIDPQTCGPLLISAPISIANSLLKSEDTTWYEIGECIEVK